MSERERVSERTTVINLRNKAAVQAAIKAGTFVRIDRMTAWGNPFRIGPDGTREEVIAKYRVWLSGQSHLLDALPELRGKALGCWCAPKACHGDVLAELEDDADTAGVVA